MKQTGLFENCLYREIGGNGAPTKEQSQLLISMIENLIMPILGDKWHIPRKKKHGGTLDLAKWKTRFFCSKNL